MNTADFECYINTSLHIEHLKEKLKRANPDLSWSPPKELLISGTKCRSTCLPDLDGTELGTGGIGTVHSYFDPSIQRNIAVKFLRTEYQDCLKAKSFIQKEYQLLAKLATSGVTPVYSVGNAKGQTFYAMKLIRGQTLHEYIDSEFGKAPFLNDSIRILVSICETIEYAHGRGILHGDIKPSNIMIGEDQVIYLIDWSLGIVKSLGVASSSISSGTPAYRAPEQVDGNIDEQTDIYLLGAVLFEILTCTAPHNHREFKKLNFEERKNQVSLSPALNPTPSVKERSSTVPSELAAICEKAMSRSEQNATYESAKDVRKDLEAWQSGNIVAAYRYRSWELLRNRIRKYPLLAVACFLLVTTLLAAFLTWRYSELKATFSDQLALQRLDSAISSWQASVNSTTLALEDEGETGELREKLLRRAVQEIERLVGGAKEVPDSDFVRLNALYFIANIMRDELSDLAESRRELVEINLELTSFENVAPKFLLLRLDVLGRLFLIDHESRSFNDAKSWLAEIEKVRNHKLKNLGRKYFANRFVLNQNIFMMRAQLLRDLDPDSLESILNDGEESVLVNCESVIERMDFEEFVPPVSLIERAKFANPNEWELAAKNIFAASLRYSTCLTRSQLAEIASFEGDFESALEHLVECIQILTQLCEQYPSKRTYKNLHCRVLEVAGNICRKQGQMEQAAVYLGNSISQMELLCKQYPKNRGLLEEYNTCLHQFALLQRDLGRPDVAAKYFKEELGTDEFSAAKHDVGMVVERAQILVALANTETDLKRFGSAVERYIRAAQLRLNAATRSPEFDENTNQICKYAEKLANLPMSETQIIRSKQVFERLFELFESTDSRQNMSGTTKGYLALAHANLGVVLNEREYIVKAHEIANEIDDLSPKLVEGLTKRIASIAAKLTE